jgi:hypothetical protein
VPVNGPSDEETCPVLDWTLLDRVTREVRMGASEGSDFSWLEGNLACDYNRAREFYGYEQGEAVCAEAEAKAGGHNCEMIPGGRFQLLKLKEGERVLHEEEPQP